MSLTNSYIQQKLSDKFSDQINIHEDEFGLLNVSSHKSLNLKVLQFLFDEEDLGFRFLTDLCGAHYPDNKENELEVVYHLHNLKYNIRLRYKVATSVAEPEVFTATQIFSSANWMERETYDFFGIRFVGHPNLKRVLNVDEMDYSPLRKEFPLEDQTRIDKDDAMFGRGGSIY